MGFLKDIDFAGITIQGAYHKITNIFIGGNRTDYRLAIYKDKESCDNGISPIQVLEGNNTIEGDFSDESVNIKKQIYDYLKTLPQYTEAIDVIEVVVEEVVEETQEEVVEEEVAQQDATPIE